MENCSIGSNHEVQFLDDIKENFVLFVLNSLRTPGHGIRESHWRLAFQVTGHAIRACGDEGTQYSAIEILRHSVVHGFVQEFIYNDEIVSDTFLFESSEVVFEALGKPVQVCHHEGHVGVPVGDCS